MQIHNEDNGWFERGELPPVGSKVEYIGINDIHAQNVEVVCHFDAQACRVAGFLRTTHFGEIYIDQAVAKFFRPIKSERERVIEAAFSCLDKKELAACEWSAHAERIIRALVDAGFTFPAEHKS